MKPRPPSHKNDASDRQPVPSYHNYNKKSFDAKHVYKNKEICQKCGDSVHVEGSVCLVKKYQCKSCHKFDHFTSLCYHKNKFIPSQGNLRPICHKWEQCMHVTNSYAATQKVYLPVMNHLFASQDTGHPI